MSSKNLPYLNKPQMRSNKILSRSQQKLVERDDVEWEKIEMAESRSSSEGRQSKKMEEA